LGMMVSTKSRIWLIRAAGVAVVVLVLYLSTGYLADSARVRVTVNNTADSAMLVIVWLDSGSENAKSLGYVNLTAHAEISMSSGNIQAGHHTIEAWWLPAADGWPPSGENNLTRECYIMPYVTKGIVFDIGQT